MAAELLRRYEKNPILTRDDVPYDVSTVHNAGVVKHQGRCVMLFRSHLSTGRSVIGIADSDDGLGFTVRAEPFMVPSRESPFAEYEEYGVEDARITPLEGYYYITYSAYSRHGVRIGLARTAGFEGLERVAFITRPDERNVVIFPGKIGGRYVRLDRPHTHINPWSIWTSCSPDLVHWGESRLVMSPGKYRWDETKIGPGAPPIRTESGWLSIYHGVFTTMAGAVYRLGAALHDIDEPSRLVGTTDGWILEPREPYERVGYVPNVVFCCGAVAEEDGTLKVYYGAADTVR